MQHETTKPLKPKFSDETMNVRYGAAVAILFLAFEIQAMRIEPLDDKVVVKRVDPESKTAGGIVLPGSAKEKPRQGKVLSVGCGRLADDGTRQPPQVAEGDRVLFSTYAGTEISLNGDELLILSENEILAVID